MLESLSQAVRLESTLGSCAAGHPIYLDAAGRASARDPEALIQIQQPAGVSMSGGPDAKQRDS
jgi:hypothetical protein